MFAQADVHDTVRTVIYTGRPMRVLKNSYNMNWEENRPNIIKDLTTKGIIPVHHDVEEMTKNGDKVPIDATFPLLMGQVAGVIDEILPAKQIVDDMVTGCIKQLRVVHGNIRPVSKL